MIQAPWSPATMKMLDVVTRNAVGIALAMRKWYEEELAQQVKSKAA